MFNYITFDISNLYLRSYLHKCDKKRITMVVK